MKPEVQDALFGWLAGLGIGSIPLLAHCFATLFVNSGKAAQGSWVADVVFLTIGLSGSCLADVLGKQESRELAVRGRAAPLFVVALAIVMVLVAMLYGFDVSGNAKGATIYGAWGLFLCAASLSIYFELTLAARRINAP